MSERFDTLSGFWTGVYAYPGGASPVAFNAVLTECAGQITGECIEPNTFADPELSDLFASFAGARMETAVSLLKTYEAAPGAGHALRYEGVVDAALTRIEGQWSTLGPLPWSGSFVMNRHAEAAAAEIAAETASVTRR